MPDYYPILPGAPLAPGGAEEVGNKAWNLMRLAQAGLPVPPAFVLPTSWRGRVAPDDEALRLALTEGVARLEAASGLSFGGRRPLLVSVRSGAAVSMPGMMETVLDVGLNAETVEGLIRLTGNPRLAWDSYRRLVQGYAEVVSNLPTAPFDALVADAMKRAEAEAERELDHRSLRDLTLAMLECYGSLTGSAFPADPKEQLMSAAAAVFRSWDAPKAQSYRRLNGISDAGGTAVTVQTMVFGNAGGASGSGVGFTRNPATGAREFYYDFQFNGQGEDVVAGRQKLRDNERLRLRLPAIWTRLNDICGELESLFGDVQDFEFTLQSSILFLLQTRRAKRTDWAALTIAADMVAEGLIKPAEALRRIEGVDLDAVARTSFAPPLPPSLAEALAAGMGVTNGAIALDSEAVKRLSGEGSPAILVRRDTATTDIEGMALATGILTASGGRTSHAAVVARQLGKVCLVGCPGLEIDMERRQCRIGGTLLNEGDFLSLDGNSGAVYPGRLAPLTERPERALAAIADWRRAAAA
ncbi:PEP/pyruvate-binding domain-containing protein [Methylocella tundrae]|uniref:PEP/pyruvate-binding domain-containing protein n=1 Tax=Methylocella tundrae TaxID=227605 RepID=UPI002ADEACF5|nr:PEP/pyruvate-binding domain-containing protein [Methylocella tundrae]WPP02909.1 PEP/pyruvate-binding domain-containing protein [Methylocella tundrae]